MNAPLRVLHVIDTLGVGGAETWLMALLRLWSQSGAVRMDFLLTSGARGVFDDEAERLGATLHYVRFSRRTLPQFTRQFRAILRAGRYDAIHDHQDYAAGWHILLGGDALPRIRIAHIHNPAYQIRNNYGVTWLRRVTAAFGKSRVGAYATHIAGTSRQVIADYGFDNPRFGHIPKAALHCGLDPALFAGDAAAAKASLCREFGWPDTCEIILCVGRIDRSAETGDPQTHKNTGFSIAVGLDCMRQDNTFRMLLVGERSAAVGSLERHVASRGAAGRVVFTGLRHDVARFMLGSDVLLFPSRGEGLGMAAVEAQAAGLPVLASTAVPRECAVVPGLVHFMDLGIGVRVWAEALRQCVNRRRDVAAANAAVAGSDFAIERSARRLEALYSTGVLA